MLYPQISGEPNFILIGISAVFGLLIIIIVYYIVVSKSRNPKRLYSNNVVAGSSRTLPTLAAGASAGAAPINSNTVPVPINTGGYYASAPTPTGTVPSVTLSNPNIKQVFNIKENIYTLDDAAGVCGALGTEVATIDQLVDAHRKGADWCNVGWTKDGIPAYPIQYSTWKTLQDNEPNKRNICGQPGINVVNDNPNNQYGVNCYGVKPEPKGSEKLKQVLQSDAQIALQAKIAQFQKNLKGIGVVPFSQDKWSA
jgi:hypothetical protein